MCIRDSTAEYNEAVVACVGRARRRFLVERARPSDSPRIYHTPRARSPPSRVRLARRRARRRRPFRRHHHLSPSSSNRSPTSCTPRTPPHRTPRRRWRTPPRAASVARAPSSSRRRATTRVEVFGRSVGLFGRLRSIRAPHSLARAERRLASSAVSHRATPRCERRRASSDASPRASRPRDAD